MFVLAPPTLPKAIGVLDYRHDDCTALAKISCNIVMRDGGMERCGHEGILALEERARLREHSTEELYYLAGPGRLSSPSSSLDYSL